MTPGVGRGHRARWTRRSTLPEVRQGIDGCLDRVPTNQRMAFVLREIEGMDTKEICKILEVTRTNLGVLLHRVRNRLRECLEAKGIEP